MSDLKTSLLNAKYIDLISLSDYLIRDCGLPEVDAEGNYLPLTNDIAASLFRWAADAEITDAAPVGDAPEQTDAEDDADAEVDQKKTIQGAAKTVRVTTKRAK